jgi:hypothetical protein
MMGEDGRSALTGVLEAGRMAPRLDARTYFNLVRILEAAMRGVLEQNDMQNASALLTMVNVYYRLEKTGKNHFVSQEQQIRDSPLWRSLRFWEMTVFEAQAQGLGKLGQSESWKTLGKVEQRQREEKEQNIAFTQVSKIVTQMLDFGGVTTDEVIQFREKMEQLEVRSIVIYIVCSAVCTSSECGAQVISKREHLDTLDLMVNQAAYQAALKKMDDAEWAASPLNTGQKFDRFGFLIEDHQEYVLGEKHEVDRAAANDGADPRRERWEAYAPSSTDGDQVDALVAQGVPHDMRRQVWKTLTAEIRKTLAEYRGGMTFHDIVEHIETSEPTKIAQTIELDLNRTFPGHSSVDTAEGQAKLRRVLVGYSHRNPEVGYCQSMNYIAAALLIVLEDEDAFWFLSMVEECILKDYHSAHILGVRTDCRLLLSLTETYLPKVYAHLTLNQVVPEVAFIQWFMCMFVNSLPFEAVMRVFDCLFEATRKAELAKSQKSQEVVVTFSFGGKIGLQFTKDVVPLVIGKIAPDGLAAENPQLCEGLALKTVQGQSVGQLSYATTMNMMKQAGRPLRLSFSARPPVENPRDILLRVALAILEKLERPLLAAQNSQEVNQVLRNAVGKIFDIDGLLRRAFDKQWAVAPHLREMHKNDIANENKRVNDSRHQREKDAAERLLVNRASDKLGNILHKGSSGDDERVESCAGTCVLRLMNGDVHRGVLFLTTYRLAFVSAEVTEPTIMDISIVAIAKLAFKKSLRLKNQYDLGVPVLKVVSKDARTLFFVFDTPERAVMTMLDAMNAAENGDEAAKSEASLLSKRIRQNHLVPSSSNSAFMKLFSGKDQLEPATALERKACDFLDRVVSLMAKITQMGESFQFAPSPRDKDIAYDAAAEYKRMGALDPGSGWRDCILNREYRLCATYPSFVVVPAAISDDEVREVTKFRSKGRLPGLSWLHPHSKAAIVRCAQPLVGITGKKSPADEQLFYLMREALPVKKPLLLLDARPYMNALANRGRKGGFEDISHYKGSEATLDFLNIDNIHVMRDSLNKMYKLVRSSKQTGPVRRQQIVDTGWLTHVGRVLGGARQIVDAIDLKGRTCIVHCSDGWDRTAQLCALSEVCLDPFYRTMEGFKAVVSREWLSFGHKFQDRTWGHKESERSPIFLQFLDTIHQLMYPYPKAFEFNEWYLLRLTDALFGNGYSEFKYNSERERVLASKSAPLVHIWSTLESDVGEFTNPKYDALANSKPLSPPTIARVWTAYFNRWIEDPVAGAATATGKADPVLRRTMEAALTGQEVQKSRRLPIIEPGPKYTGWLWHNLTIDKRRWFALYPSTQGEACLVIYDVDKSGYSHVPQGAIALPDGQFGVRKVVQVPRRPARSARPASPASLATNPRASCALLPAPPLSARTVCAEQVDEGISVRAEGRRI